MDESCDTGTVLLPTRSDRNPGGRNGGTSRQAEALVRSINAVCGPWVLVRNGFGLAVIALGGRVRAFVEAPGQLNQAAARHCDRVTPMAAELPKTLKGAL